MNNGPWSPEHIYQEIAGYTATRHRGKNFKIESSNNEYQIKLKRRNTIYNVNTIKHS